MSIEGGAWRSEGTETNSFNAVFDAWLAKHIFPRRWFSKVSLRAAPRHRPIAFAPEGSPLDRCYQRGIILRPMFTGLIEDVGKIASLRLSQGSAVLAVKTNLPLRSMELGASIAVNGACLTVTKKGPSTFTVDVSPETLNRTSLATVGIGSLVNLERPLRLQDRLGGHLVTGHIDGVAVLESIQTRREFNFFTFRIPVRLGAFLVSKGSVAVDGISLTINQCSARRFSVAIIPFTMEHTNLRARRVGDRVNIETDLIGKYVQKFVKTQN